MRLRPDRFCNYVYAWAVTRVENREEFDANLLAPLPGQRRKRVRATTMEADQDGAAFMSFMSAVNG